MDEQLRAQQDYGNRPHSRSSTRSRTPDLEDDIASNAAHVAKRPRELDHLYSSSEDTMEEDALVTEIKIDLQPPDSNDESDDDILEEGLDSDTL